MTERETRLRERGQINRRDYLRLLVIASGGLLMGTAGLASGIFRQHGGSGPPKRIAGSVDPGELVSFSYPGDDDSAVALRLEDGELVAYSSICTHLLCAVLWRRELSVLECPCHKGIFNERTGEVVAGPPPRPLPRIRLEERADGVYATGQDN